MPSKWRLEQNRLIETHGQRCVYCGEWPNDRNPLTKDHMISIDYQKKNNIKIPDRDNLILACFSCNQRKSNKTLVEFFHSLPFPSKNPIIRFIQENVRTY